MKKISFVSLQKKLDSSVNDIHNREPLIINKNQLNNFLNVKKDGRKF